MFANIFERGDSIDRVKENDDSPCINRIKNVT